MLSNTNNAQIFFFTIWSKPEQKVEKKKGCSGLQVGRPCCSLDTSHASFFSMPLKQHKDQACDCLLNLWSGSNKTYKSSSRAKRRPKRMGHVLHQHLFIQGVKGFRVLDIWIPETSSTVLACPVYPGLSFSSTRAVIDMCEKCNPSNDLWYTSYLHTVICWGDQ